MWKINLQGIEELQHDTNYGVTWEPIKEKGQAPGRISHHKAAVLGNCVVVFGGIQGINEVQDVFEFDVNREQWTKLK